MTTYYVGPGGNDASAGTSWATRKLTLTGAEDIPVAAGDTVFVAPGTYREDVTLDVSGSAGNPITYIADRAGEFTDGVGGVIRVTGSDDDETFTRSHCITGGGRDYRTFRGFWFDGTTSGSEGSVDINAGDNWIVEDCVFGSTASHHIRISTGTSATIRRCYSVLCGNAFVNCSDGTGLTNAGHTIENCTVIMSKTYAVRSSKIGGITIRDCLFHSKDRGVQVVSALPGGYTAVSIQRTQFLGCNVAVQATATGEIVEDYCNFSNNGTDRTTVSTGSNSTAKMPGLALPMLVSGHRMPPPLIGEFTEWSAFRRLTGGTPATSDLFGMTRPSTDSKKSWGPFQFVDVQQDTSTVFTGSEASLELADAGEFATIMQVTPGESLTLSVWVEWETNYAGTLPALVVREYGQSDRTDTATGSANVEENLTLTFTPSTTWITVIFRSSNTATSGSYAVYFGKETASS